MKRYVFAGLAFCLVIGFQNCAGNKQFSDMNSSDALGNPFEVTPMEKIDVSQTEIIEIPESSYLEAQLQDAILQTKATSNFTTHHLEIDVKTGVIDVIEDNSGEAITGLQYCLNSQDLSQLDTILTDSKICEDKVIAQDQRACTMQYQFPYARLHFAETGAVALGEVFNACHRGYDLCGEKRDLLQEFLGKVQSELKSKKCEFQIVRK